MEYYWPDDRIGGYPEFGEPDGIGRGFRPGYVDDGYVRRRPLPELEYIDPAPDYYRTGTGRGGYAYPLQQQAIVPAPPVEYLKPERSDLGTGLRDSKLVRPRSHNHRAGSSRSDLSGYGRPSEHDDASEMRRLKKKVEQEEHQKHGFQAAAAAAMGYALHERHEKKEAEEELKKLKKGTDKEEKKHRYHFYRGEGGLQ